MPLTHINPGEVVRKTENLQLLECFGSSSKCPIVPACQLKKVLVQAQDAFLDVLDEISLADLVENKSKLHKLSDVA